MVEMSRTPAQKNSEDGTAFLPSNPSCRAVRSKRRVKRRRNPSLKKASQSDTLLFWIFSEKSTNFIQKIQQFRRKGKIVEKRRRKCRKRRAGRNSPLKPPFRPARIFVGVFGNFRDKCKRKMRRKNEGAVEDQMGTHLLLVFIFNPNTNRVITVA